jgi:glycosyltransferase involved in cell wall biosynthesis
VVTPDTLTERMAGPAIRSWHIAADLAVDHEVTLVSTQACTLPEQSFRTMAVESREQVARLAANADVTIVQGDVLTRYPVLGRAGLAVVVDLYDPFMFEELEQTRSLDHATRMSATADTRRVVIDSLVRGDVFLCASEKQRDLWIGHLAAVGRINPVSYDEDPTLRRLVRVVPFGIPDSPPVQTRHAIKGGLPGVTADDLVLLWGGGVYDWLDPITVVEAVANLSTRIPNLRLVFLGMHHPHPDVPEMAIARQTRALARARGLEDTHVYFIDGWVPYAERANWLLDADVAVSAHRDHLETAYAFRTRILDCLWARVPVVATAGDTFAQLIDQHGLGCTVPPGDVDATATALERLLLDRHARESARTALDTLAPAFAWHTVLTPLREYCQDPVIASDHLDHQVRRRLDRQLRATGPRSRLGRDIEIFRRHFGQGGLPLVARMASQRLRRTLRLRFPRGGFRSR